MNVQTDQLSCSVAIPLLNEENNLSQLHQRLVAVFQAEKILYEIIFVDDGSTDNSLAVIRDIAEKDSNVKYISFSRNFGHELATTAGLDYCRGNIIILIDADLQDPPEVIPHMIQKWKEGYKVVYAKRNIREGESLCKRFTSWVFYRLFEKLSEISIPLDTGDFRLMDRSIVQCLRQCRENYRFIRGLVSWIGFEQTKIDYDRAERHSGETKYSFWKLILLSLDAIMGFSNTPLRIASLLGLLTTIASLTVSIAVVVHKLFFGLDIPGYALTTAGLFFLFGINMFLLGILGEYIGRIYRQVQNRPLYLIKESHGVMVDGKRSL